MKVYFIILLTVISSLRLFGQQFETTKLHQNPSDLTAVTYPRKDFNSKPCALLKVQIPMSGISFEGNVIGDVEFKSGEYWVYLSEGSKNIMVKHEACSPTIINFADYGVEHLASKSTYVLILDPPHTVLFDVFFKIYPPNAILIIDDVEYDLEDGIASLSLTAKNHSYIVVAPGYKSQSNVFRVNEDGNTKIVVELDPKENVITSVPQASNSNTFDNSIRKKVGIYDENRVLNSIPEAVEAQKKINEVKTKYEAEYNKLTAHYQNEYEEFQKRQSNMSPATIEKRSNELDDYKKKIDLFKKLAEEDIAKMQNDLLQPSIDKCNVALNTIKTSMDLDIIQSAIATKADDIDYVDITDEVISMLK